MGPKTLELLRAVTATLAGHIQSFVIYHARTLKVQFSTMITREPHGNNLFRGYTTLQARKQAIADGIFNMCMLCECHTIFCCEEPYSGSGEEVREFSSALIKKSSNRFFLRETLGNLFCKIYS
jgi:hypothetical protein